LAGCAVSKSRDNIQYRFRIEKSIIQLLSKTQEKRLMVYYNDFTQHCGYTKEHEKFPVSIDRSPLRHVKKLVEIVNIY
jgi:hypothetical protein